jgi:hypothetical protein
MATVVATDTLMAPASTATRMVAQMATVAAVAAVMVEEASAEAQEATRCQTLVLA